MPDIASDSDSDHDAIEPSERQANASSDPLNDQVCDVHIYNTTSSSFRACSKLGCPCALA